METVLIATACSILGFALGLYVSKRGGNNIQNELKLLWPKWSTIRWLDSSHGFRLGKIIKHEFLLDGNLSGFWVETETRPHKGSYPSYETVFIPRGSAIQYPLAPEKKTNLWSEIKI